MKILLSFLFLLFPLFLPSCSGSGTRGDADDDVDGAAEDVEDVEGEDGEPMPCTQDMECTDGDPCNGNEWCDPGLLICQSGAARPDGTICSVDPRRICVAGRCSESACGDGFLDTGTDEFCEPPGEGLCDEQCLQICEGDPDCADDGAICNGEEYCNLDTTRCSRRDRPEDGRVCSLDPRGLCLGGLCTESICGDGYLDGGGGEFCEPPYEEGCGADCQLPCGTDTDCMDDGNRCNGMEYCSLDTSRCSRSERPEPGTVCLEDPRSICLIGLCLPSLCGDGFLDTGGGEFCEPPNVEECDGSCLIPCGGDSDCLDDGNPCNGEEYCDLDTSRCSSRSVPADGTVCRADPRRICLGRVCQLSLCGDGFVDTGTEPPEECEDENAVSGDGCEPVTCAYSCHEDGDCAVADACADGVCDPESHTCALGLAPAGTLCRSSTGLCDVEELCTGLDPVCPADAFAPPGTPCDDGNPDTEPDACDGSGLCIGEGGCRLSGITALAGLGHHTCALVDTGSMQCWGRNFEGQIGNGTTTEALTPSPVVGLPAPVAAFDVGQYHTCAVTDAGSALCWGLNSRGQVGDGTTVNRAAATPVTELSSGVAAAAGGYLHSCALLDTGGVRCWGGNADGQLGNGTTTDSLAPVDVNGLSSGATAVAGGESHTCVVLASGGVRCWGLNADGQLGDGTTTTALAPVAVTGLSSAVTALAAGSDHTCALLDTGGVMCWGSNSSGSLGNGTTTGSAVPVPVTGLSSGVTAVAAGFGHTCALLGSGGVRCWGSNLSGQLGDGTIENSSVPVDVTGLSSGVAALSAGVWHSCALLGSGNVRCWGYNVSGELGDGADMYIGTPTDVIGISSGAGNVTAGLYHACSLSLAGGALCWGANQYGQLGDGTATFKTNPVAVSGLSSGVRNVNACWYHTCAVLTSGALRCWGLNGSGQLGDGTTTDRHAPAAVSGFSSGAAEVDLGRLHTCALTAAGGVRCWGDNASGQLGDGSNRDSTTPVDVTGLASGVIDVTAGGSHTCAVLGTGGVQCWGDGRDGQLGTGSSRSYSTPTDVTGLSSGVTAVTAGDSHTCALRSTGGVLCWGSNVYGALGDGTTTDRNTPTAVSGLSSGVAAISAGNDHTCALLDTGGLLCWGANSMRQIGDGTATNRRAPVAVTGLAAGVAAVAAGGNITCAVLDSGGIKCWGSNQFGSVTGFFIGYPHDVVCP